MQLYENALSSFHPAFKTGKHVLQATEKPFINVIYDKDPLTQWVYGRVALVGEAAHCTTPHGSRR